MSRTAEPVLARLVARAEHDPRVLAVILFGSRARGEASAASDVDVCLVLTPGAGAGGAPSETRLGYLSEFDLDVSVFQQLPLHLRRQVLKEGRVMFVRDEDALYDLAIRTVRAYEDFRHIQRQYLDAVARD